MRAAVLIFSVMAVCASSACAQQTEQPTQKVCTQMGCASGLMIEVDPTYRWAPGAYTFDFTLDGHVVHCEGTLPLKPCGQGQSLTCDAAGVMVGESGCALPPAAHGFAMIQMEGAPKTVDVKVMRGATVIAQQTFKPSYKISQPNGPGCEPVCHSASHMLTLRP